MDMISGHLSQVYYDSSFMNAAPADNSIKVQGMVHTHQQMGSFTFIRLRLADQVIQCIVDDQTMVTFAPGVEPSEQFDDESSLLCQGRLLRDPRAPLGFELRLEKITVLARPSQTRPVHLGKKKHHINLETDLSLRPITLRHQQRRAVFKLQEGICRGFREFLNKQGFTEIHTPKIVSTGAEGGSNIFRLDYFGRKAYLAQSPQLYKQMMVGVFQRVFEVGPVFRAEKHNTVRHLNEYTSLDFEMGFIESFHDIMNMETAMLRSVFELLRSEYAGPLKTLEIELTPPVAIPSVTFDQAKQMVSSQYNRPVKDPNDLEPEEERLLGALIRQETGSDFVFITHYPSKKRPFYAMNDPQNARLSLSFDLLYKGLEVTTGGQRIHDYAMQIAKMQSLDMDTELFKEYLLIHACGIPPHGGLGIGLERLLMQMIGADNIRETALFPRDMTRLNP